MSDWRQNVPASVTDPTDPRGVFVATSQDRRWLWHLEGSLAVNAPYDSILYRLQRDLSQYLHETCEHHWSSYEGDEDIPAHRQCLWCNEVEWTGADHD